MGEPEDDLTAKFRDALDIVRKCGGRLPDDTYLEKLATESAKRMTRTPDIDLYLLWGLRDFVEASLASSSADADCSLRDFCLNLMASCLGCSASCRRQAEEICARLLTGAKEGTSSSLRTTAGLQMLLRLADVCGHGWVLESSLLDKVVLPSWREDFGESNSIFWTRALEELTKKCMGAILSAVSSQKSDTWEEEADKVSALLRSEAATSSMLVSLLKKEISEKMQEGGSASFGAAKSRRKLVSEKWAKAACSQLDQYSPARETECLVLSLALSDPKGAAKKLSLDLSAWAGDVDARKDERALALLKSAGFLFGFPELRSHILKPVEETLLLIIRKELESEKGSDFSKTVAVLAHSPLAFSGAPADSPVQEMLWQLVDAHLVKNEFFTGHPKLLRLVLGLIHKGLRERQSENLQDHWKKLVALTLHQDVEESDKTSSLACLEILLESSYSKQIHLSFDQLFSELWGLAKKTNWGVEDALLRLAAKGIELCDVADSVAEGDTDMLLNLAFVYSSDPNSFLRSGSMELFRAVAARAPGRLQRRRDEAVALLCRILLEDTEAVARRSAAGFARALGRGYGGGVDDRLRDCLVEALLDLDCDTKETVLGYWSDRLAKVLQSTDSSRLSSVLEKERITDALSVALQDFDRNFLVKLEDVLKANSLDTLTDLNHSPRAKIPKLAEKTSEKHFAATSRVSSTGKDGDDVIENLVGSNDIALVKACHSHGYANGRSSQEETTHRTGGKKLSYSTEEFVALYSDWLRVESSAEERVEEYCELQMGLDSVLSDIIQSVSPANEIDGLDCV